LAKIGNTPPCRIKAGWVFNIPLCCRRRSKELWEKGKKWEGGTRIKNLVWGKKRKGREKKGRGKKEGRKKRKKEGEKKEGRKRKKKVGEKKGRSHLEASQICELALFFFFFFKKNKKFFCHPQNPPHPKPPPIIRQNNFK